MQALFGAMLKDKGISDFAKFFGQQGKESLIYGLSGSQKYSALAAAYSLNPVPTVIVTYDQQQLKDWRADLQSLLPEATVLELPELDMVSFNTAVKSMESLTKRMDILGRLVLGEPVIILATPQAAVQKGMSSQDFLRLSIRVNIGDTLDRNKLLEQLVSLGYQRTEEAAQVEMLGQFSTRGGIVDVYPINSLNPVRIEFFDDDVDSIRQFSLETQRSIKNLDMTEIMPVAIEQSYKKQDSFLTFLPKNGVAVFDEPVRIREQSIKLAKENPEIKNRLVSWETLLEEAKLHCVVYMTLMLQQIHGGQPSLLAGIKIIGMTAYQGQMDMVASDTEDWLKKKYRILVMAASEQKAASLREFFAQRRIAASIFAEANGIRPNMVTVSVGVLGNGFVLPDAYLVVMTEKDIFGRQKKKLAKVDRKESISHFREIKPGDYVVHVSHGIGKYMGVETLVINGIHKDYMFIKYGGDDKLFVPTDQVNMLQKYIGNEGEIPVLHKMGDSRWSKAVKKAKKSVEDIAQELIRLYAARQKAVGTAFDDPDAEIFMHEFEEQFPYEETPDQLAAISEIKADMAKPAPMDRLLCGDVGFGKTEVAIRAAYNAVLGQKQVAVLVPTTVLAQQHYKTFMERFNSVGVRIDVINRFRSVKEQHRILQDTENGYINILIGTHALLNPKKVKFQDLGLLIVDEEQRFGVKQKEKIKKLATGIDCLTLSATPIPRTLHMSLVGARDMSVIETAPAERFPVQTYVAESRDDIMRDAIRRELKRNGQVYFVYNRVESIERMYIMLEQLVPEARIIIAHGQMPEEQLERVMVEFYEGKYDVLLATSIIENGLDLPNANTILVYDADRFGLSQLYQMRGRVGRSNRMAYAYFMYQENKVLTEVAEKRLQAIKEFAELGAGFKIAMRDLEIRGAGNILGAQQHGHIASVGFEMYCRLLNEAITSIKTGKPAVEVMDPIIELQVEAYIDADYISDAMHKIEVYRKLASLRELNQVDDMRDELIDRFGEITVPVANLLQIVIIRIYAKKLGIKLVTQKPGFLEITFLPKSNFESENLMKLMELLGKTVAVVPGNNLMKIKLGPKRTAAIVSFALGCLKVLAGEPIKIARKKRQE